jgi:hypothetical protein
MMKVIEECAHTAVFALGRATLSLLPDASNMATARGSMFPSFNPQPPLMVPAVDVWNVKDRIEEIVLLFD